MQHNVKRGFNSKVNANIDEILTMLYSLSLIGIDIYFDNTIANHYKLIFKGKELEFTTYKDVKHALILISM